MKEIYTALIKAQAQFPTVEKNTAVNAGKFNFKFANYSAICEAIKKPLSDNNLAFMHVTGVGLDVNSERLTTSVIHESGEQISTSQPVPVIPDAQQYGAWLTYMRRYQLSALLGLASDEDVEAPEISNIEIKAAPKWSKSSVIDIEQYADHLKRSVSDLLSEITKKPVNKISDVPVAWEQHILKTLEKMSAES